MRALISAQYALAEQRDGAVVVGAGRGLEAMMLAAEPIPVTAKDLQLRGLRLVTAGASCGMPEG